MSDYFSKRNAPPPQEVRHDVPQHVRGRIWSTIAPEIGYGNSMKMFMNDVEVILRKLYGFLAQSPTNIDQHDGYPALDHFRNCSDVQALDFIEVCFRVNRSCGGQQTVNAINRVFRQEGIGYELTPYLGPELARGEIRFGPELPDEFFPKMIPRDHQLMHDEVVRPALQVLANPALNVANAEMLKAHSALRVGNFDDAITQCGSAFESVLKTICDLKKWPYDADRDTCSKLVEICRENGLFPSFYAPMLEAVGTVRNKLGDAHGRGPKRQHVVTKEQADHLVHISSAHILFLARQAGLK